MSDKNNQYFLSMVIIGALFFVFGFITWVNGTLIPYLKIACELETDAQSYLVTTAFFFAYLMMAMPAARVLKITGYKKGMALGLVVMAAGALVFIPAAQLRNYETFLLGLFVIGAGLALLQTASNPYVSIIGPMESAATRISIMGICNKVAGIIAGLIFGYIALSDDGLEAKLQAMDIVQRDAALDELASRVVVPYLIIAGILVILGVAILKSSLPDINDDGEDDNPLLVEKVRSGIWAYPHLLLGVLALFFYVGVEVMAGDTIISFGKSQGIALSQARFLSQFTLGFMLLGYVIGIFTIPRYISQQKALLICGLLGVIFTVGAITTEKYVSVTFIALLGLANSLVWPAIWPLAIEGLGKFTKIGAALLVMGIVGGAILPLVYGWLSELEGWNSRSAYSIMIPCYAFIAYYALKGHQVGRKQIDKSMH